MCSLTLIDPEQVRQRPLCSGKSVLSLVAGMLRKLGRDAIKLPPRARIRGYAAFRWVLLPD